MTVPLLWVGLLVSSSPQLISTAGLSQLLAERDSNVSVIDARNDYTLYLESHIPRAVCSIADQATFAGQRFELVAYFARARLSVR